MIIITSSLDPTAIKGPWSNQQTAGLIFHLSSDLWKIIQSSQFNPPAAVGFVDEDYRYKSVATQICHDAGLEPGTFAYEAVTLPLHCDRFRI